LFVGIAPTRHLVDPKKSNRVLGFPALITGLYQFYRVPVAPARSSGPLLTGLSSKSIAPPGGRRVRHHSSLGTASSGQQTHRHHLQGPPQLIYKDWSVAYDPWPTSRRPSPKPKVSKSTRLVIDKSSRVRLKTLKTRY